MMVLFCGSTAVHAEPILLAQWLIGTGSGNPGAIEEVTSVSFGLAYDPQNPIDCVGCQHLLSLMTVVPGTILKFNSSNSPKFNAVVERLTDSQNESITSFLFLHDDSGTIVGGSGGGINEDRSFGILLGRQIDFIRVIVHEVNVSEDEFNGINQNHRVKPVRFCGEGL